MKNRKAKLLGFLLLILAISFLGLTGCQDDDDDDDIGEHVMPWGFVLYDSGVEVARYYQGELEQDSEITVHAGEMSGHIAVYFIDQEGFDFNPVNNDDLNDGHHWLELTMQDTTVAKVWRHDQDTGEDWGFHAVGAAEGTTGLHIALVHEDHYGFIMPDDVWVPVTVSHESDGHGPPVGLVVKDEETGTVLVTATADNVTGQLTVPLNGQTDHLEVEFFDENDVYFNPEVPVHSLAGIIADTNIAEFVSEAGNGEHWVFLLNGLQNGNTTLELDLMHDDHVGWGVALPIPVVVQ